MHIISRSGRITFAYACPAPTMMLCACACAAELAPTRLSFLSCIVIDRGRLVDISRSSSTALSRQSTPVGKLASVPYVYYGPGYTFCGTSLLYSLLQSLLLLKLPSPPPVCEVVLVSIYSSDFANY